ncbi:MAG: tRNA pseudouridine(38-40) synthase TruA [Clostridia bacterium]|nr:tRNA pseudouridine(38-40) synthase TruA [Clostridia bacterium]
MKNYKMTIAYDGTRYQGWQRLKDTDKSIQGKIEDVLSRMCGHKVEIHGSGRTDGGVHAKGQVASFKIQTDKSCQEIRDYLNEYLPEDIAVTAVCEADDRFHARLTRCRKTYLYRINNSNISNVFERKYVYNVPEELRVDKMKKAASYLKGEHDFVGFSSLKKVKKSTIRTIYDVKIEREGSEVRIYITGDGFLYNMVRIIAGTLIEIGKGEKEPECILKVLETKNRENAGFTAPAQALTLYEVRYDL